MQPTDILLALLTVMIWGMNFVVIKLGLAGLPPLLFSALRFVFAALPLVFFIKRPAIPWRYLAGFGLFQFALQFSLLFSGMQLGIGAGLASLVIQLQAFFTIGLAVLLLAERPLLMQLAGALVALAGIALVASHLEAQATVTGFLLVIGAGLSWASANIVTKKIGKVNPLALMAWGSLMAAPPLLLASALLEGPAAWHGAFAHFGWVSVAAVFYQSYPNTIVGYGIWTILMRKYPAATVAPFSLLVPLVGMVSAATLLGETLQWWKIVAGLLVLGGLALNQFGARLLPLLRRS